MSSSDSDANDSNHAPDSNSQSILQNNDEDTLRLMISTDNHLGYSERDPVRGMDSFAAFEEVLYLAKRFQCDMVLIAGDLFHENRPSRQTLHRTMEILRRYCMGPGAVKIKILSDQARNFRSTVSGLVNYQDPNYSVDLPLFSIHGNHDDPSRDSGGELLAALDLLAVSNLVNYFGRQDQVDKIEISPILIQKGDTKVALYGLGSMRDERLNRMWASKKVRFLRPAEDDGNEEFTDGFFNVFALHQNRDLGRGPKNCVQESMIPEWMDLVVWGHEHECQIDFRESVVGTFQIIQPGSSVATSLIAGEAATKKVGILDINGQNFRIHPVPLNHVRSFVTSDISLRDHRTNLDPDDPKIEKKVVSLLEEEVQLMILNARQKRQELVNEARTAGSNTSDSNCGLRYILQKPDEVLVRVRVEHMGFSTLNNQRFGAKFVGDVANPGDILLFHRKKDPRLASTVLTKSMQPLAPEELARTRMEDLVKEYLEAPERKLKLLEEQALCEAMEDYVEKSLPAAILDKAHDLLKSKQDKLISGHTTEKGKDGRSSQSMESVDEDVRENEISRIDTSLAESRSGQRNKRVSTASVESSFDMNVSMGRMDDEEENESDDDKVPPKRTATARNGRGRPPPSRTGKRKATQRSEVESLSDNDEVRPEKAASKPAGRSKRAAAKKVIYPVDDESDDEISIPESEEDEVIERNPKKRAAPSPRTRRTSLTPQRSLSGTAVKRATTKTTGSRRQKKYDSEDEDGDYKNERGADNLDEDWGTAATSTSQFS